jgi:hypothetical protein
VHRNTVNLAVFILVAAVGLILTPQPAGTRLWWLAGLFVVVVLLAVFTPTTAQAILEPLDLGGGTEPPRSGLPAMGWAVLLVLVVWAVRFLAWFIPGVANWISAAFHRAAAVPAVAGASAASLHAQAPPWPPTGPEASSTGDSPFASAPPPADENREGGASHG